MFKKVSVAFLALFGLVTGAMADYTTDMQTTFVAQIGALLTDAGLMLADVVPVVFGIMIIFMLLKLGKKMFRQAS